MVAQGTLYLYRILESLGLQGQLPMILEMDNLGAINIAYSWNVGGRTGNRLQIYPNGIEKPMNVTGETQTKGHK